MKERLDILLVKKGLVSSREKAKAIIMSGNVFVNGQKEEKAGSNFEETAKILIKENPLKYVSRGGLKLEKAIKVFQISLKGKICIDIGSSTGGFTDCMLQNGAKKVYAVDSGTNQLAWKLRQEEKVICMEKTNARYLTKEQIEEDICFISADVSFISLTKILIPVWDLLIEEGESVCLIKPQFEAGREKVGKKGVVREKSVHQEVIEKIICFAVQIGFKIKGLDYSPMKGPEGNIEYLLWIQKPLKQEETDIVNFQEEIKNTIEKAHSDLR